MMLLSLPNLNFQTTISMKMVFVNNIFPRTLGVQAMCKVIIFCIINNFLTAVEHQIVQTYILTATSSFKMNHIKHQRQNSQTLVLVSAIKQKTQRTLILKQINKMMKNNLHKAEATLLKMNKVKVNENDNKLNFIIIF